MKKILLIVLLFLAFGTIGSLLGVFLAKNYVFHQCNLWFKSDTCIQHSNNVVIEDILVTDDKTKGSKEDIRKILDTCYTIKTPYSTGSGTAFTDGKNHYILTCGHVVEDLREVNEIEEIVNGMPSIRTEVRWKKAIIYKDYTMGLGTFKYSDEATVRAYSACEEEDPRGLDLAVLQVKYGNWFPKENVPFIPNKTLKIGDDLYHVGSLYGVYRESFIKGYVSKIFWRDNNSLNGNLFHVADLGIKSGSSGGGIFTKIDGKFYYVGMCVRGDNGGFCMFKPPEVIRDWLRYKKFDFMCK